MFTHRNINLANSWGKSSHTKGYGKNLKVLYKKKQAYHWDNDNIKESEGKVEPTSPTPIHLGLLAEIPGIKLASDLDEISHDTDHKKGIKSKEPGTDDTTSN